MVRQKLEAPADLLEAAWQRAFGTALAHFRDRGTEPDHATLEAATFLELDLAEQNPHAGTRTAYRQQGEDTGRMVLGELYAGTATGLIEPDGTVSIRSRHGESGS